MVLVRQYSLGGDGRETSLAAEWKVEGRPAATAEALRLLERQARRRPTPADRQRLWETGRDLLAADELSALRRRLAESPDELLEVVSHDDALPLEFAANGDEFLGLTHAVARIVRPDSRRERHESPLRSAPSDGLRGVILADSKFDLLEAHYEAADLRRNWLRSGRFADVRLLGSYVTVREAAEALADCDWLHVCGHAEGNTGGAWRLRDGLLTADAICEATERRAPRFVFAHACSSAAAGGVGRSVRDALLDNGCRHLLGAAVTIPDRRTRPFVQTFYRELLAGAPIGLAVLAGRRAVARAEGPSSILWGSYVLYGSPCDRLVVETPQYASSVRPIGVESTRSETADQFPRNCQVCGRLIHTRHGLADPTKTGLPATTAICRPCARSSTPSSAQSLAPTPNDVAGGAPRDAGETTAPRPAPSVETPPAPPLSAPSARAASIEPAEVSEVSEPLEAPGPVARPETARHEPWRARLEYAVQRFVQQLGAAVTSDSAVSAPAERDRLHELRIVRSDPLARSATHLDIRFVELDAPAGPVDSAPVLRRLARFAPADGEEVVCFVSAGGWTAGAEALVTGAPDQAYFSPARSLVLLDARTGRFVWRTGDRRAESLQSLFDLESDDEKRVRMRDGILAICPLETSLAADVLARQFHVPLPIVIDAMREAAAAAGLHLDEIPGFGWVLS